MKVIKAAMLPHGLVSIFMRYVERTWSTAGLDLFSIETGNFVQSAIRLGSRVDSYLEYLL
jgi:hypothetical protein